MPGKIIIPKVAGGENAAWEKLTQSLRHATEAIQEIGHHRGEQRQWSAFGILIQNLEQNLQRLKVAGRKKMPSLEELLRQNGIN